MERLDLCVHSGEGQSTSLMWEEWIEDTEELCAEMSQLRNYVHGIKGWLMWRYAGYSKAYLPGEHEQRDSHARCISTFEGLFLSILDNPVSEQSSHQLEGAVKSSTTMTTLPPEELLVHTLDLLEYRLHRLEFLFNGGDPESNLSKGTTAAARLSKLQNALGQLAARSRPIEQLLRLRTSTT